jgi:hypothetical protein
VSSNRSNLVALVNININPIDGNGDDINSYLQSSSPQKSVFCNDAGGPDQCSPAPSPGSLERYLAAPTYEEAVPTAIIEAAVQDGSLGTMPFGATALTLCDTCHLNPARYSKSPSNCMECENNEIYLSLGESAGRLFHGEPQRHVGRDSWSVAGFPMQASPTRGLSVMGSDASAGSYGSHGSFNSIVSVNSRTSRRGRKRWGQALTPPSALRRRCSSPVNVQRHVSLLCKFLIESSFLLSLCTDIVAAKQEERELDGRSSLLLYNTRLRQIFQIPIRVGKTRRSNSSFALPMDLLSEHGNRHAIATLFRLRRSRRSSEPFGRMPL